MYNHLILFLYSVRTPETNLIRIPAEYKHFMDAYFSFVFSSSKTCFLVL